jgi:hypothetical protein
VTEPKTADDAIVALQTILSRCSRPRSRQWGSFWADQRGLSIGASTESLKRARVESPSSRLPSSRQFSARTSSFDAFSDKIAARNSARRAARTG